MRRHILVVEDDENLLPLIARTLEIEGYRVARATCGPEALEHVRSQVPDLIVSDIMMPGMDGFELLERLRADSRVQSVPVIFLTALGDQTSLERGHRLGVDHYLVKPFTPAQLLATVSGTLRRYAELRTGGLVASRRQAMIPATVECTPTGVELIDASVGGLATGHVYLASGDFGAAKQVLALQMLTATVARGDTALLVTPERLDAVVYLGRSLGLPVHDAVRRGRLIVCGLAEGFEQRLETRENVVAFGEEIAEWAMQNRCALVAVTGLLTVLCSNPRLPLSAPLLGELVDALGRAGATVLLVAEEPVTPVEERAEAYLRRAAFGTIAMRNDETAPGRGLLALEAMRGVTDAPAPAAFRIVPGDGLVAVDPEAELDLPACLERLRQDADLDTGPEAGARGAIVPRKTGGWRMRDPFALFLRDCLTTAARTGAPHALVLLYLPPPALRQAVSPPSGPIAESDLQGLLGPQDVLCWLRPTEAAILSLGSTPAQARSFADRLAARIGHLLNDRGLTRPVRVAVAHTDEGATPDLLLAVLERQLAVVETADASEPAVA